MILHDVTCIWTRQVALEKDGFDLDLSRSASDYAWEMDEAQAWAVYAPRRFRHQKVGAGVS